MLRPVYCIDVLEVVKEIIPRRWKRFVITPIAIVVVVLSPELAQRASSWLGEQYAQRLGQLVTETILPDAAVLQGPLLSGPGLS